MENGHKLAVCTMTFPGPDYGCIHQHVSIRDTSSVSAPAKTSLKYDTYPLDNDLYMRKLLAILHRNSNMRGLRRTIIPLYYL